MAVFRSNEQTTMTGDVQSGNSDGGVVYIKNDLTGIDADDDDGV